MEKVLFIEGVEVRAGDVLFQLDKKPFIERLATAKSVLSVGYSPTQALKAMEEVMATMPSNVGYEPKNRNGISRSDAEAQR